MSFEAVENVKQLSVHHKAVEPLAALARTAMTVLADEPNCQQAATTSREVVL